MPIITRIADFHTKMTEWRHGFTPIPKPRSTSTRLQNSFPSSSTRIPRMVPYFAVQLV